MPSAIARAEIVQVRKRRGGRRRRVGVGSVRCATLARVGSGDARRRRFPVRPPSAPRRSSSRTAPSGSRPAAAEVQEFSPETYDLGLRGRPRRWGAPRAGSLQATERSGWRAETTTSYERIAADLVVDSSKQIGVGDGPTAVAFGAGAVWVANVNDGTVSRIDPETYEVVETIEVGNAPAGIAVSGGRVWVSVQAPPHSLRHAAARSSAGRRTMQSHALRDERRLVQHAQRARLARCRGRSSRPLRHRPGCEPAPVAGEPPWSGQRAASFERARVSVSPP